MNKYFKGKHGPLLIAEIGGNHEGSFEYARELAIQAIDSNVDVSPPSSLLTVRDTICSPAAGKSKI